MALRALTVPVMFGLSIPLAFLSPQAAEISWFLVAPAEHLVSRRFGLRLALDPPLAAAPGEGPAQFST